MSYEVYKVLHIVGLALVVMSLGGITMHVLNGGTKESNTFRKGAMITHGVGLLLLLVAGFGMLAKLRIFAPPPWVIAKLVIWLLLGAFVAIAYRKPGAARKLWLAIPILVAVAGALAIYK